MKKALEFLKNHVEVAFATCENNRPKIRVFQIMKMDDTDLYFATSPVKGVYKQLQNNPYIEILSREGQISVRCVGKAVFDVDEETKKWIYEHNSVLSRLYSSYDKMVYFKMTIEQMDYYDLEPTPPVLKHFDLVNHTEGNGFVGERFR